jgi:uncharacterized SAM-binding protein YcdF (DUF218 family)
MIDVAELHRSGVSSLILISGHSAKGDREATEAARFMERGIELGIPPAAIVLEEAATNTKENVLNSLPIIDRAIGLEQIESVLFVCKSFHARRVFMTARRFMPPTVVIGIHPIVDRRQIRRDTWWQNTDNRNRVLAEVRRIGEYAVQGDLDVI